MIISSRYIRNFRILLYESSTVIQGLKCLRKHSVTYNINTDCKNTVTSIVIHKYNDLRTMQVHIFTYAVLVLDILVYVNFFGFLL